MKRFFHISVIILFAIALVACSEKKDQEVEEPAEGETIEQTATDSPDKTGEATDPAVQENDERIEQAGDATEAKEEEIAKKGDSKTEAPAKSSGYMEGYAISMNDLVTSNPTKLSKSKAIDLVGKGQLILFYSNGAAYFVYHADGSFAGKRLARMADAKAIKIKGDMRKKDGLRIIIAEDMQMVK